MGFINSSGFTPDNITLENDESGKAKLKDEFRVESREIIEHELRLTVLEVNASVDDVNDDFAELFSDSDGLRNTVDASTTSNYFSLSYQNPTYQAMDTSGLNSLGRESSSFVTQKTISDINELILSWRNYCYSNATSYYHECRIKYNYSDSTTAYSNVVNFNNSSGEWKDYENPNPTKIVSSVEVQLRRCQGDGIWYYSNDYAYLGTPQAKNIILNYDKAKPQIVYLMAFSDDTSTADIGTITFELKNDSTSDSTGELSPEEVHNVSLTDDPDKLIIHQKSDDLSKITKLVLLIKEA